MSAKSAWRNIPRNTGHIEPSSIVTKAEVERLEALRAKPTPEHAPRPSYVDHARVDSQIEKLNERRLTHQRTRLMVADYQLNRDRMKAVNRDRAKAAFNKKSASHER